MCSSAQPPPDWIRVPLLDFFDYCIVHIHMVDVSEIGVNVTMYGLLEGPSSFIQSDLVEAVPELLPKNTTLS
jgi:hypothetical protein